jgi:hypothetical protein
MNEQALAERFSRDVDSMLKKSSVMELEQLPADYREALDMANTLAQVDVSHESLGRQTIRDRLIRSIDSSTATFAGRKHSTQQFRRNKLRRRLLISITGALALLLVISFSFPGGPAAAAQSISDGVKVIVLGAYSTAQRIESYITGEPLPEDSWDISLFPGAGVGGNGLPGTNPVVRTVHNYQDAQELTGFRIRMPSFLPDGYSLDEIKLAPVWTGAGALLFKNNPNAFLFYRGPGQNIVIVQQPMGTQSVGNTGAAVGHFFSFATNGTLVEVEMNGHTAAWADDRLLIWEQEGLSYIVGGLGLDLEEAIQIATSLR